MEAVASGLGALFGGGFVGWLAKYLIQRAFHQFDVLTEKVTDIDKEVDKLACTVREVKNTLDSIQSLLLAMTLEDERKHANSH